MRLLSSLSVGAAALFGIFAFSALAQWRGRRPVRIVAAIVYYGVAMVLWSILSFMAVTTLSRYEALIWYRYLVVAQSVAASAFLFLALAHGSRRFSVFEYAAVFLPPVLIFAIQCFDPAAIVAGSFFGPLGTVARYSLNAPWPYLWAAFLVIQSFGGAYVFRGAPRAEEGAKMSDRWAPAVFPFLVVALCSVGLSGSMANRYLLPPLEPPVLFLFGILLLATGAGGGAEFRQSGSRLTGFGIRRASPLGALTPEWLNRAFKVCPVGLAVVDLESRRVATANEAASRILGLQVADLEGNTLEGLGIRMAGSIEGRVLPLGPGKPAAELRCVVDRGDGRLLPVTLSAFPVDTVDRQASLVSIVDRSELEYLKSELLRTRKVDSIGLLAAGIGHDFADIMTALMGNISAATAMAGEGSEIAAALSGADSACKRGRFLARQLFTLAREGEPIVANVDVFALAKDATRFALAGAATAAVYASEPGLPSVRGDAGQLVQVFNAVALRAVRAMGGSGQLRVRAYPETIGPEAQSRKDSVGTLSGGVYAVVEFEDQGKALSPEEFDRLFEPDDGDKMRTSRDFILAKAVLDSHGGVILADPSAGGGSLFRIYLPAAEERSGSFDAQETPTGGAAIVMDDELAVRSSLERMLSVQGYSVFSAADGAEAVARFKSLAEKGTVVSLAILDLVVPGGIGGLDAARSMRALNADVPIYLISGYADAALPADYRSFGYDGFLQKPFGLDDLKRMLAAALVDPERSLRQTRPGSWRSRAAPRA